MKNKLYTLCGMLLTISCLQANMLSDAWDKTKETAQSTWDKTKQGWQDLDENAKNAIIAGSIIGGTAALTGAGYGAYASQQDKMYTRPSITTEEQQHRIQESVNRFKIEQPQRAQGLGSAINRMQ